MTEILTATFTAGHQLLTVSTSFGRGMMCHPGGGRVNPRSKRGKTHKKGEGYK